MRIISIALIAVGLMNSVAGHGEKPPVGAGLRLSVVPTSASFVKNDGPTFRLTIENSGPSCGPVLVDPSLTSKPIPRRPGLVVTIVVRRLGDGKIVPSRPQAIAETSEIRADEFRWLTCGEFFGRLLSSDSGTWSDWKFDLAPGRYEVEARAALRVRTYLELQAPLRSEVARLHNFPPDRLDEVLPDLVISSPRREFVVVSSRE